jgi:hexosaminidase
MSHRERVPFAAILVTVLLSLGPALALAADATIAIVPQPVTVTPQKGFFALTARTVIWTDGATLGIGHQLARYLEPATGLELSVRRGTGAGAGRIVLVRDRTLSRLGAEGYVLDVTPARVTVRAPELAGVFYGIQTIRQLLPPEILREAKVAGVQWTMPAVHIEDKPRFPWRGMHLDVGRHFMPKEFIKKYLDLLALHKMNTFHWHLTEDQGWRLEILQYPKLTEVGAWRSETIVGRQSGNQKDWKFDAKRHGGYYTRDDVREIVEYAKERFINVVPEIEMPGHAVAAIAAYPSLGVDAAGTQVATWWGVFDNILSPEEGTVKFMQNVLSEVLEIFPSRFIHVGGDEAAKARWKSSARVQERMKELGIADEDALQSWFIRQMDDFLTSKGRRLIGWDEILDGGLAPGAAVMSWRGTRGGMAAARQGHDVVMAPTSNTYFDYYQARPQESEPLAIGGYLPLETVYAFEPVPQDLEPQFRQHILGAQGQVWTEYLETPKQVEYMAFPRACALAEVLWTPADEKDFAGFLARLQVHQRRLSILDVNYRPVAAAAVTTSGGTRPSCSARCPSR